MVLKKELTLYERDDKGELISQEVELVLSKVDKENYPDLVGQTIGAIPMTRGALKKMFGVDGKATDVQPDTNKDIDAEIVLKYCKNPVYTKEDLKFVKPVIIRSIVKTIFDVSGVKVDEEAGVRKLDANDEFGKNS